MYLFLILFHKIFIEDFYKKNIGDIVVVNLHTLKNKEKYVIDTIKYKDRFILSNTVIEFKKNTIDIFSQYAKISSYNDLDWKILFYKFLPLLLNLNLGKNYSLNLYFDKAEYLGYKFTKLKISFQFHLKLFSLNSYYAGIEGILTEYQDFIIPPEITSILHLPYIQKLLSFFPSILPLYFNVESKKELTDIKIATKDMELDIVYRPSQTYIKGIIYKSNTFDCTVFQSLHPLAKCAVSLHDFSYNQIKIKNFNSNIFLKFKGDNIILLIPNSHVDMNIFNTNIFSTGEKCRIKGILSYEYLFAKVYFQKRCKFNLEKFNISPLVVQIQYKSPQYIISTIIHSLTVGNITSSLKFKNTRLSLECFKTSDMIEFSFKLNTKAYYSIQQLLFFDNFINQQNKITLTGKLNFSNTSRSWEFFNLSGNIDNIKINDGTIIINNQQQISFLNFETEYLIHTEEYIKNIGAFIEDFSCNINIKTLRMTMQNLEILGDFSGCKSLFNDYAQIYNTGGSWRFSSDRKLENMEFSITANSGTITIPTKQYDLTTNHIIVVYIPIKRVANIIELHPNVTFIPQNEYINVDLFTFFQLNNNHIILTSEGKLKLNIKSNIFISKFSCQIDFDFRTYKTTILHLKSLFYFSIKNIAQLKNSFQELFDFVDLQGYFGIRGVLSIKDNRLERIDTNISFIIPQLVLDNLRLSKIRGKIPFSINSDKIKKGSVKLNVEKPYQISFTSTINNISPPCISIKSMSIKHLLISVLISKFSVCINTNEQKVNAFTIPVEKVNINISEFIPFSSFISSVSGKNGRCEILINNGRFDCLIPLSISSPHFSCENAKISVSGKDTDTPPNISYDFRATFKNVDMETLLKKLNFSQSFNGKYIISIDRLKIINKTINEAEGYIDSIENSQKEISSGFFNQVIKELFNIKMKDIKMKKNFNYLGIYFHYIKGKLIIKPLYYIDNEKKVNKYNLADFKDRQTLLKSKGIKDCLIYGKGINAINICTKGGLIISVDKLLKLKNKLFSPTK